MKVKLIFILFFSLGSLVFAQKKDSLSPRYTPNFMLGVDVLNGGLAVASERKLFQAFLSSQVGKNTHAIAEAGMERNTYKKNGYDALAKGFFLKAGGFYMLAKDPENKYNGFFAGGKLAGSLFRQEYRAVPVRGYQGSDSSVPFPASNQSAYWVEALLGGRVQLFASKFYIDVNVQPKYLLLSTKQEGIQPIIVPGFGKSSTKFNVGFSWNLAYQF